MTHSLRQQAMLLHQSTGIVDTHCDTVHLFENREDYKFDQLNKMGHLDLPRLEKGAVNVQFFAIYIEPEHKPSGALRRALRLIDSYYQTLAGLEDRITPVFNYRDIEKNRAEGKISAVLAVEGGEVIENDLGLLRIFYQLGVRSFGLTWNQRNLIADGIGEREAGGGLTRFGSKVIAELNKLGIIVDAAHISEKGFGDVIEVSTAPVIVSHANAQAIYDHPRNLNDRQLKALAEKGGIIGLSFYPQFIGDKSVTLDNLVDHFDHIASLIGVEHMGIGSDFDGIKETLPGLEDASRLANLTEALLRRGFKEKEIQKILRDNYLKLLGSVLDH